MTQSSDVQGNINKIIIVKVKFILTFTIILKNIFFYGRKCHKNGVQKGFYVGSGIGFLSA